MKGRFAVVACLALGGVRGAQAQPVVQTQQDVSGGAETAIAVNPKNPYEVVIGFNSGTVLGLNGAFSPLAPSQTTAAVTYPTFADPNVAFDENGNGILTGLLSGAISSVTHQPDTSAVVAYQLIRATATSAAAWSAPVVLEEFARWPTGHFLDRPMVAVDRRASQSPNTLYAVWTFFMGIPQFGLLPAADIHVARSDDSGMTWGAPGTVTSGVVAGAAPAVAFDGTLFVAFVRLSLGGTRIELARSADGGANFDDPVLVDTTLITYPYPIPAQHERGLNPYPAIAIDRLNRIYIVWNDKRALNDGTSEVYLRRSDDGGRTWKALGDAKKVVASGGSGAYRFLPAIAIDPEANDALWVGFYDTRNSGGTNTTADYFAARSSDGGQSFSELQLSTATSNTVGARINYGDYSWLSARGGALHAAWTDARAGSARVFTARVAPCENRARVTAVSTSDSGAGSLRTALAESLACVDVGFATPPPSVEFNVGSTIRLASTLPMAGREITIDGQTEEDFAGRQITPNGAPPIAIRPARAFAGDAGILVSASGSGATLNRLSLGGFASAIAVDSAAPRTTISNCWIGLDFARSIDPNLTGIRLRGDSSSVINNRIAANDTGLHLAASASKVGLNLVGLESANKLGIVVTGGHNLIGGDAGPNVISGNSTAGLQITGENATHNVVSDNRIGTDRDGVAAVPNDIGVWVNGSASENLIGLPKDRVVGANVISGNKAFGVEIKDSSRNGVLGNLIGVAADGASALPNRTGVRIDGKSVGNRIGRGSCEGIQGNTISGNLERGVWIGHDGTNGNQIEGNRIGVAANGITAVPNQHEAVFAGGDDGPNFVGATEQYAGNVIRHNHAGVVSEPRALLSVRGNSIDQNGGPGIDVSDDERPSITSAARGSSRIEVAFTGQPNASASVDVYATPALPAPPQDHYAGAQYLGSGMAVTDSAGAGSVAFAYSGALPADPRITLTTTIGDKTSEFSAPAMLGSIPDPWPGRMLRRFSDLLVRLRDGIFGGRSPKPTPACP